MNRERRLWVRPSVRRLGFTWRFGGRAHQSQPCFGPYILIPGAGFRNQDYFSIDKTSGTEIGDDPHFEAKWARFARVIWVLLAIFTVLGGAGVFGKGPLAHATATTPAGALAVKYDRFARYETPSTLRLSVAPTAAVQDGILRIFVSQSIAGTLDAQRTNPRPFATVLSDGGEILEFKAVPDSTRAVKLTQTFTRFGTLRGTIAVPGQAGVSIHQVIYP